MSEECGLCFECHTVREFIEKTFASKGIEILWQGSGTDEVGMDSKTGRILIKISQKYFRPAEVDLLLGDSTKACEKFGWRPEYSFDDLVKEMVEADY